MVELWVDRRGTLMEAQAPFILGVAMTDASKTSRKPDSPSLSVQV